MHPLLPVYCMQSGLGWGGKGCVKGCWRRTLLFGLSAPQDTQRRTFITLPPEGKRRLWGLSFWRDPARREALGRGCFQGERDVAEGWLWRCSPFALRGRDRGGCLSTAIGTAHHAYVQAYSYIQLCNNVWFFRGEQNLCAVSPKTPLTLLAERIQNLFLSTYSRFAFNSTSAALSFSSSQNVLALASLPLNAHVHTRAQSFTTNISMEKLF